MAREEGAAAIISAVSLPPSLSLPTETGMSSSVDADSWGIFSFRRVHISWATDLMLGAFDYYRGKSIEAYQIVPDETHWTIDVPDLSQPWSPNQAPGWRWLKEEWKYP